MKNFTVLLAVFCLLICYLAGCTPEPTETNGSTTSPSSSVTTTLTTTPPDEDSSGIGGVDGNWYFHAEYADRYEIENRMISLVGKDIYAEWKNDFKFVNPSGTRERSDFNSYTLLRELNVPREDVEAMCERYENNFPGNIYFTEEQIEAIYNGTDEDLLRAFASPYAIVVESKIYPPKWLYEHTVEDYVAAGITYEIFRAKLPQITFTCDYENHWTTILEKYDSLRRSEDPTYVGNSITVSSTVKVGRNTYSKQWLLEHSIEEYREAGITSDLLSESIAGIIINSQSYSDRLDAYNRYVALQKLEAEETATVK